MPSDYYKQHWVEIDSERLAAYDQILAYHPAMEPILRPLDLREGLRVLDLGSGPAHTTIELARRVGTSGRVTGIDINADFVTRSRELAEKAGLKVDFVQSPFPPIPCPDRSFDRVWCKNVLEYVDSAPATVIEMARVAAVGGIVVAIDSDWEMLALDLGADARARSDRVLTAAKSIAVHEPRIGRMLYGMFRAAGLKDVTVEVMAGADTQGRSTPMLKTSLARYARDSGKIPPDEVSAWLQDIDRALAQGRFCFVLPQFIVRGVKG